MKRLVLLVDTDMFMKQKSCLKTMRTKTAAKLQLGVGTDGVITPVSKFGANRFLCKARLSFSICVIIRFVIIW